MEAFFAAPEPAQRPAAQRHVEATLTRSQTPSRVAPGNNQDDGHLFVNPAAWELEVADPLAAISFEWPQAPRLAPAGRSLPGDDSPSPPSISAESAGRERVRRAAGGAGLGGPSPEPHAAGETAPAIDGSGGSPCPPWCALLRGCCGAAAAAPSLLALRTEGEASTEAIPRRPGSTPPMAPPPTRPKRRRTCDGVPRQPAAAAHAGGRAREKKTAIATVEWREFDSVNRRVYEHLRTKARFFDTTGQRPKAAGRQRGGGLRAVAFFAPCTAMVL